MGADHGEGEAGRMSEAEKKMRELKGYGWPETTKEQRKRKANTEYGIARDRLRAIPSEMEVLLFLHDQGKIIDATRLVKCTEWANKYNGVDMFFEERERPEIGKVYCAIVDVKNVDLGTLGTDYGNLYLEIKDGYRDGWAVKEYATEHIDGKEIVKPNRYLAYVRGGKAFGGILADQTTAYSDEKSERENARDLVKYYFEHQNILNHDIFIVSGDDANNWIMNKVPELQRKGRRKNEELSPQIPNWKKEYPLMQVRRVESGEWETQQTGKGVLLLQATGLEPGHYERHDDGRVEWVDYPLEQWEKGNEHVNKLAEDQKRGLSLLTCLYAKGINEITCLEGIPGIDAERRERIKTVLSEMRIGKAWTE